LLLFHSNKCYASTPLRCTVKYINNHALKHTGKVRFGSLGRTTHLVPVLSYRSGGKRQISGTRTELYSEICHHLRQHRRSSEEQGQHHTRVCAGCSKSNYEIRNLQTGLQKPRNRTNVSSHVSKNVHPITGQEGQGWSRGIALLFL
jgi:hypothetical protein